MNANFDWSQFEPVEESQQDQGDQKKRDPQETNKIDWSQFEKVEQKPEEKNKPAYKPTNQKGKFFENIANNFSNFYQNVSTPHPKEEKSPYDEIDQKLLKHNPSFDVQGALEAGYNPKEINRHLQSFEKERSYLEKGGRVGAQYALGAAENALLPYEVSVTPLKSKEAQNASYRETIGEDLERLLEKKASGHWDDQDQKLYDSLAEQIKDPSKSEKFVNTAHLGVRDISEKVTGLDLQPEGVLEKAANWIGFLKDPKKISQVLKLGVQPKELIKAISPSGTEVLRGLGAGTALQMAEDGQFGPIGTMAAMIVGDLAGAGAAGAAKGSAKIIFQPKKTLAEVAAKFTPKDKIDLQKDIIKGFKDSGIQADLGTLTDSNLIRWIQARLSQSGLTGKSLEEFKTTLTNEIKEEYKAIADSVGELKHSTSHEAGEVLRESLKSHRESDLRETRKFYSEANNALKKDSHVLSERLGNAIKNLQEELKPGAIKSSEQKVVLDAVNRLKYDVFDSSGKLMGAKVKDLMNNKIALNDIINYEVQGGSKQLLKNLVAELDRAIISHGKENPTFAKNYINANKRFSEHAKTFRNKDINKMLFESDPSKLMNKMDTIQGIKSIEKALNKSIEGKELFENLKRLKLERAIGDNLIDSSTQQAKLGTFSKLLDKGKNKELFKELLPKDAYKRLEKLQSNSGKLADSYDKFYNASKSGVVAADAAIIFKVLADVGHLLYGNPWPLLKSGGAVLSARQLSKLMADPEFLKLAEEAILSSEKSSSKGLLNNKDMMKHLEKLKPYILPLVKSTNES